MFKSYSRHHKIEKYHHSNFPEIVIIILDNNLYWDTDCLFSKLLNPLCLRLEFYIEFQTSVLKIHMDTVTAGHGDITA